MGDAMMLLMAPAMAPAATVCCMVMFCVLETARFDIWKAVKRRLFCAAMPINGEAMPMWFIREAMSVAVAMSSG